MVPGARLELARDCSHRILSPGCLPFHHPGRFSDEASPGFEPGIKLLQSHALPLGHDAVIGYDFKGKISVNRKVFMRQRRTYFYRLDGRGRLIHDSSELKDPEFLDFFIERIRKNDTGEFSEYPYLSVCNGEWNFIQPATTVFIFKKLENGKLYYSPSHSVIFQPENLRIRQESLIHPAPLEEWGTFSSELLLDFSKRITNENGKLEFSFENRSFPLLEN